MNELLKINDQLMNAPAGVVVALFAIGLGYILKSAAFFPNNRIPLVLVLATTVLFPLVQFCADLIANNRDALLRIPFNAALGFIIGFLAWAFHAQILRRYIDPKIFRTGNTEEFTNNNPKPPETKP
jgi:uncharacterized membrane protein YagU involved in acid resistance